MSGTDVQQVWDLTALPKYVREQRTFADDWRVFARPVGSGLTAVSEAIEFVEDDDGVPVGMRLTFTAAAESDEINLEAWFMQSVIR